MELSRLRPQPTAFFIGPVSSMCVTSHACATSVDRGRGPPRRRTQDGGVREVEVPEVATRGRTVAEQVQLPGEAVSGGRRPGPSRSVGREKPFLFCGLPKKGSGKD